MRLGQPVNSVPSAKLQLLKKKSSHFTAGIVKSSKIPARKSRHVHKAKELNPTQHKVFRVFNHLAATAGSIYHSALALFLLVSSLPASTLTTCDRRREICKANKEPHNTKKTSFYQKFFFGSRFYSFHGWFWLSFRLMGLWCLISHRVNGVPWNNCNFFVEKMLKFVFLSRQIFSKDLQNSSNFLLYF